MSTTKMWFLQVFLNVRKMHSLRTVDAARLPAIVPTLPGPGATRGVIRTAWSPGLPLSAPPETKTHSAQNGSKKTKGANVQTPEMP
jgi:hypothetical protein